ncbi:MAG: DHA2 family efflux MFS transporter permease subunit [Galactobacter sp.]
MSSSSPMSASAWFPPAQAWRAMVGLLLGFFMILLDTTIVVTALPRMMTELNADLNAGVWITSAYLLTYAVPLLVSGRLGDRFGAKNIFLLGLVIFTGASLWCGLSSSVAWLIAARAVQGLGAALLSPQSMTLITRMFAPEKRGAPMAVWGATAGVATLAGPLLGGVLVDALGWEWIFFVNLPVGVLCFIMVAVWVPKLPVHSHSFDLLGVLLSSVGLFLLVFGIQQGESHDWNRIWGPFMAWEFIVAGCVILGVFIWWQSRNSKEPLLPLHLFRSRNVVLANVTATCMGVAVTTFGLPVMLYLQTVDGFSPTQAALVMAPMSIVSILVAPLAGSMVSRVDSKWMAAPGFAIFAAGMFASAWYLVQQSDIIWLLLASAVMGIGSAAVWPSISLTNSRDLTQADAGAGSGIFNTTRQVGSVIGAAVIAWAMQAQITAEVRDATASLPAEARRQAQALSAQGNSGGASVPEFLHQAFASAYGVSILVPACAAVLGAIAAFCFAPRASARAEASQAETSSNHLNNANHAAQESTHGTH